MAMRDWITKDFGWKLFSLLLAVGIWLTVHKIYEETSLPGASVVETTYRNLPVRVISANGDVHDFRADPEVVAVTVKGSANVMEVLQAKELRVSVDLTDPKASAHGRLPLDVASPPGVTLVKIEPQEVDVVEPTARPRNP